MISFQVGFILAVFRTHSGVIDQNFFILIKREIGRDTECLW